jgi:hypothetical protein
LSQQALLTAPTEGAYSPRAAKENTATRQKHSVSQENTKLKEHDKKKQLMYTPTQSLKKQYEKKKKLRKL